MIRWFVCNMCLVLLLVGCGVPKATLNGKVTYKGKPLNSGRVYFNVDEGRAVRSAEIQSDGSYSIANVSPGSAKVAVVVPPAAKPSSDPTAPIVPAPAVAPVEIPEKYAKVETSGLTYKVEAGPHSHDVGLE